MKIVINACYGGFGLSDKAIAWLKKKGITAHYYDIARDNPLLVECIEALGDDADGTYAELRIVDIPDGVDYEIEEYDGIESIAEKHRKWF